MKISAHNGYYLFIQYTYDTLKILKKASKVFNTKEKNEDDLFKYKQKSEVMFASVQSEVSECVV